MSSPQYSMASTSYSESFLFPFLFCRHGLIIVVLVFNFWSENEILQMKIHFFSLLLADQNCERVQIAGSQHILQGWKSPPLSNQTTSYMVRSTTAYFHSDFSLNEQKTTLTDMKLIYSRAAVQMLQPSSNSNSRRYSNSSSRATSTCRLQLLHTRECSRVRDFWHTIFEIRGKKGFCRAAHAPWPALSTTLNDDSSGMQQLLQLQQQQQQQSAAEPYSAPPAAAVAR